uniref:Tetratricopeptide repeat domain 6 n=1 Tax=Aquila chrysaetos chrysaetos TaxID=223781 RepID=A0A663DXZ1_AQUCH
MELKKDELASLCIHQLAEMDEESFMSQPVQQALIQSFCQNHNKAIECLREAAATQHEPLMFVILGKIQMKAKKTKVRKVYIIYMPSKTMFFFLKEIAFKVLINCGLLYVELGDYANACEDFKEATLLSPYDSQIFQAIGICYHRLNEFEEAVRSFDQALKLDPVSVDAYVGRGNSYMENGHEAGCKQAQKDFLRAIHLNPKCIKARICLGYNFKALGKLQRAWSQFTVAICIDSKCHAAYDGRASVCLQMGETFAAFQDINAALKLTTTAPLLTNRGVISQLMGYLPCAMKDYQQAISVDPNYALAYFNAANIYFHNRQFSQAYCYYSKVLQLDPRNESAVMNRAITNALLNSIEEAKEDFEKAICLCPFSAAVYFNRANFYYGLKQYELAEKDISTALSIQPNDALMYKFRADIRGKLGFYKEAVEDYKQAINCSLFVSVKR